MTVPVLQGFLLCCLLFLSTGVKTTAATTTTTQAPTPTPTPANNPTVTVGGPFFSTPSTPAQDPVNNLNPNNIPPYFFFEDGAQVALANLLTNRFPGPAGLLLANEALDLPDGYLPYRLLTGANQANPNQGNTGAGTNNQVNQFNQALQYLWLFD